MCSVTQTVTDAAVSCSKIKYQDAVYLWSFFLVLARSETPGGSLLRPSSERFLTTPRPPNLLLLNSPINRHTLSTRPKPHQAHLPRRTTDSWFLWTPFPSAELYYSYRQPPATCLRLPRFGVAVRLVTTPPYTIRISVRTSGIPFSTTSLPPHTTRRLQRHLSLNRKALICYSSTAYNV